MTLALFPTAPHRWRALAAGAACAVALAGPALAQCDTAPVVQPETLEHEGFATIAAVLSNDHDPDGEALTLSLVGKTCTSAVSVNRDVLAIGPTGDWECSVTYRVTDERNRSTLGLLTVKLLALFKDGFESGGTTAWSQACSTGCGSEPEGLSLEDPR